MTQSKPGCQHAFAWIHKNIMERYGHVLGVCGVGFYMFLAKYTNKDRECRPSIRRLAADTGLGERQVKRHLKQLKQLQLIAVFRLNHRSNSYVLLPLCSTPGEANGYPKNGTSNSCAKPDSYQVNKCSTSDINVPCASDINVPCASDINVPCEVTLMSPVDAPHIRENNKKEQEAGEQEAKPTPPKPPLEISSQEIQTPPQEPVIQPTPADLTTQGLVNAWFRFNCGTSAKERDPVEVARTIGELVRSHTAEAKAVWDYIHDPYRLRNQHLWQFQQHFEIARKKAANSWEAKWAEAGKRFDELNARDPGWVAFMERQKKLRCGNTNNGQPATR